jgi:branched-chain amino acid transport system substrate-binding protein
MHHRFCSRSVACVLAVGALLAACGSDSKSASSPASTAASSGTAAPATSGTTSGTSAPVSSSAPGSTTGGAAASGDVDPATQKIFKDAGYDWSDVDLSNVTVKVGQLIPRSGDFSFLGDAMNGGAELAAEQIRKAGGPKIEFETEDIGAGDPQLSTTGARTLTADGVPVIQSSFGPATLAVVPIVEQSKTLLFQTAGATADQLSISDYLWMGRPTATDPYPALAEYVHQAMPDVRKAAVMVWNEGSAIKSADLITGGWKAAGNEITLQELVEVGATDMGASATRVVGSGAEVVFLITFGGDTATAINALKDAGFKGSIVGTDWNASVTKATGGNDEGFIYVTDAQDANLTDPYAQLYLKGYPAKTGAALDVFSALFWDNTVHIADLVARVVRAGGDPNSSTALIDALKAKPSMPDSTAGTPVGWDIKTKAQTVKPSALYLIKGGQPTTIAIVQDGKLEVGKTLEDLG